MTSLGLWMAVVVVQDYENQMARWRGKQAGTELGQSVLMLRTLKLGGQRAVDPNPFVLSEMLTIAFPQQIWETRYYTKLL